MRKITEKVCRAFIEGKEQSMGNTYTNGQELYLHGNKIAWKEGNKVYATLAGWGTPTTRERLDGLCSLMGLDYTKRFSQVNFNQFFWDKEIDVHDIVELV